MTRKKRKNMPEDTLAAPPTLTALQPNSTEQYRTTVITATGANYRNGAQAYLNGAACVTQFVSGQQVAFDVNNTQIPDVAAYAVYVQNPDGRQSAPMNLDVFAHPPETPTLLTTDLRTGTEVHPDVVKAHAESLLAAANPFPEAPPPPAAPEKGVA